MTTTISNEMSPAALKTIETVQKLLNLANRNPNAEEAAAANAKAQQLLAAHNLEMSQVEEATGIKDGKREQAKLLGGMYQYQRDLWRAVAELNFCLYWNQNTWTERKVQRYSAWGFWNHEKQKYTNYRTEVTIARTWEHRIVGRVVNTTATRMMGLYLEQAVERLLMDRLKEQSGNPNSQRFSSWAVAFREGAIDDITSRLYTEREKVLKEEQVRMARAAEEARSRAAAAGSTANALTLADMIQSERDANVDEVLGEGYSARKRAERAEAARLAAEAEREYAEWAKANPEEAAKEEAKRKEQERKAWAKRSRGSAAPERASDKNWGAYKEGKAAGASVSIHQQMGAGKAGLLK